MYREQCGFQYIFIGCGDHSNAAHWHNSTAESDDVSTDCSPNHIALFLLMVEEGMMTGGNDDHTVGQKTLTSRWDSRSVPPKTSLGRRGTPPGYIGPLLAAPRWCSISTRGLAGSNGCLMATEEAPH